MPTFVAEQARFRNVLVATTRQATAAHLYGVGGGRIAQFLGE